MVFIALSQNVRVPVCMHVGYICILCMYVCMYVFMYVCMYVYIYIIYVCVCVCIVCVCVGGWMAVGVCKL